MIPALFFGFGIGLAAYASVKFWFWEPAPRKRSRLSLPKESIQQPQALLESPSHDQAAKASSCPPTDNGAHSEAYEEIGGFECSQDESDRETVGPSLTTESAEKDESNAWFLIRTSKGTLKACRCASWTPHTVAGPFESKLAAGQAKKKYSARTSQSPRA